MITLILGVQQLSFAGFAGVSRKKAPGSSEGL